MKNKGCTNPDCRECQVRTHFDEENKFCPQCGEELSYVCLKCHTVLPDGTNKYCMRCDAGRKDKLAILQKKAGAAGGAVAAVAAFAVENKAVILPAVKKAAPVVIKAGKTVIKIIK